MELDLAKTLPNEEAPKICINLLNRLQAKEITMDEFEFELACYALESLEELVWKPMPIKPTVLHELDQQKMSYEWKRLKGDERREIINYTMNQTEVKVYGEKYNKVLVDNLSHACGLEHYIEVFLKKGDKINARKVWELYKDYPEETDVWKKKKFQSNSTETGS